ncbi:PDZ domain-containing protein [Flavobacterium jejuense]|uniref:PDZ domain-containing protein n=1 Tax=Flavobacterium jejuense TaxID=1544455 RepID=A0ABX0IZF9_9FLAO|nr:site-2 protease family protein [Flavobacterium jejuense]NHN27105.1 PDZ domain-containing protein [Flavobacterium jejuense]
MIQLAQILFILSVLVILHEFGHYITAKIFKVRVEKFYLFMDAGFSLIKKKIGETEWGIGWLPLGGYVKLAGMIDESMDTEQMKQEAQPWEFRSKPAWQRLIIMLGGIIVNILLAWFIFTIMYTTVGKKVISTNELQKNGLSFGEVGQNVGFKNGDKIIGIDGEFYDDFKFMTMGVLFGDKVEIDRQGEKVELLLTDEQKGEIIKKEGRGFVHARSNMNQYFIDSFKGQHNFFEKYDEIIGIDDYKFTYVDEFIDTLKNLKKDSINFILKRNNEEISIKTKVDSSLINLKNYGLAYNYLLKNSFISGFAENSIGEKQGLEFKDIIVSINNTKIETNKELNNILSHNKDKEISLTVLRKGKEELLKIKLDKTGKLGIGLDDKEEEKYTVVEKLGFSQAFPEAVKQSWSLFKYNVQSLKLIARPKTGAYTQVQSPIGIARRLPDTWNWEFIWNFTALFSIGLAFMNLLPIPGLDGGHALFTIAEMITGKTLSDKAMGYVQTAGMIILLTLMALTFGKDIYFWISETFFNKN